MIWKLSGKILFNGILGLAALIIINIAGTIVNINIAINAASVFLAGFLGLPGIILLYLLKLAGN